MTSVGIQINFNLTISVQGVPANVPIGIGVSLGEPKIVTHQPPISSEQRNPVPRFLNHQQRICAACGVEYIDQSVPMNQYPLCPMCEDDLHTIQYQSEISQPRYVTPQPEVGKSFNEINNVNWQKEGF